MIQIYHCVQLNSVVFGVTLRLLVIKNFFVSPAINTAAYYQRCVTTCGLTVTRWRRVDNTWPVAAQNRDFCLPHRRNIAMPFGAEKLEWLGYPTVKKIRRYLYSFSQNVRT